MEKFVRNAAIPLGLPDLQEALRRLGVLQAPALMVHSSLSSCGRVKGGEQAVIEALLLWVGGGTLAMPTHSYCYPIGTSPAPCFDPAATPSVVGAITDAFWRLPGAVRSSHPTHSLACVGPLARDICADHQWSDTPCGSGTPYGKLVALDCAALMFGVGLDAYTFFHTAEDAAHCPYLYEANPCEISLRDAIGIQWTFADFRQDMQVPRRFGSMDSWLEERGLLFRSRLGLGELLFIPHAGAVHRELVAALELDPWLLVDEAARSGGLSRARSPRGPALGHDRISR